MNHGRRKLISLSQLNIVWPLNIRFLAVCKTLWPLIYIFWQPMTPRRLYSPEIRPEEEWCYRK